MALMDAKEYDPRPAQRRRTAIWASILLVVILGALWFWPSGRFRYHRQWNITNSFFTAIEDHDFDTAYGLYNADPGWKQHPEKYGQYPLSQFTNDWREYSGAGIAKHRALCVMEPPGQAEASGVAAVVQVNQQSEPAILWIENKSGSITTSPVDLYRLTRGSVFARIFCTR